MSYYHHQIPDFSRYSSQFRWDDINFSLYLDTGKRDQVIGFYYQVTGRSLSKEEEQWLLGGFSYLAQTLEGGSYFSLPRLSDEDGDKEANKRFPLPWLLYRKFVREIQDTEIPWNQMKGRDGQNLICRCFGVYKEDIHELVGSGVEVSGLRDLGDHLQAGIGCGTCREDLLEELRPLLSTPIKEESKSSYEQQLWEKLDPQSLANEAHDILRRFSGSHAQFGPLKLGGTRPGSVLVLVDRKLESVALEELRVVLGEEFSRELGPGLGIVFIKN